MPSYYYGASENARNRLRGKKCGMCVHCRRLESDPSTLRCLSRFDNGETRRAEDSPEKLYHQPACLGFRQKPEQKSPAGAGNEEDTNDT